MNVKLLDTNTINKIAAGQRDVEKIFIADT